MGKIYENYKNFIILKTCLLYRIKELDKITAINKGKFRIKERRMEIEILL